MAVHDCAKPVFCDNGDDEDDEGPAIFKRSSTSKQNQFNSGSKKLSSHKHDEARKRPVSCSSPINRENLSSQKNKINSNVKSSTEKTSAGTLNSGASVPSQVKVLSKNGSTSCSTKGSNMSRMPAKVEYSDDSDDDRPLSSRYNSATGVQKSNSAKPEPVLKRSPEIKAKVAVEDNMILDKSCAKKEDSDDSDDELPLSARLASSSAAVARTSSLGTKKVNETSTPSLTPAQKNKPIVKDSFDDSEDERPLFSSLKPKFSAEEKSLASKFKANGSGKKEPNSDLKPPTSSTPAQKNKAVVKDSSDDSDDDKPLISRVKSANAEEKVMASKFKANGSGKKEPNVDLKPLKSSNKRSIEDTNNSTESLFKKAKVADPSASGKVKIEIAAKKERQEDDNDHIPIAQRMKKANSSNSTVKVIKKTTSSFKKDSKTKKAMKDSKYSKSLKVPPGSDGGQKWMTLVHNGVIFPPPYKPHGVKMLYNGQPVDLTPAQEEVATMFAVMKDTDYASKPKFIENFMNDWRQVLGKNHIIKKFELCDFTPIYEWHLKEKEKKKQMSTEEKKALKEDKSKLEEKYMWAIVDGVKEKVGNFRVEPPGLFRGRGEHPKMGKLKRRIRPRDITINIGKDAPVPECPIPGERWKEVKHDNSVTWLAFWNDPINPKEFKYVFLAASSSLKGQSDREKYEKARLLKDYIHGIRATYTKDFNSKDPTKRQIAVATYLIDKLALRAGNEKDDDEADTVGCCTLKVENVVCVPPNKLQFDFLGKDSIRYFNTVEVELPVYKAIGEFQTAKKSDGKKKDGGDDLFDMLDTSKLNAHLKELMPGLTAKVFRTYNASITLDDMLNRETRDGTLPEKIAVYQHANKEVAIICNHQRSVSKSHDAQMSRLNEKIDELKAQREELRVDLSRARKGKPTLKTKKNLSPEALEKKLNQVDEKIDKMELEKKTKDSLKTVALGTSKINYLDPRISVAWCKRHEVPIEKIFNKSLLAKFAWAMDVDPSYRF